MPNPHPATRNPKFPRGAIHWAVLVFMLGFAVLLVVLCWYYLIPAGEVARDASHADKMKLRAVSTLLMTVVLFILFVGLLLVLRAGRVFFPKQATVRPPKTQYVDAWAESAKRLKVPPNVDGDDNPSGE